MSDESQITVSTTATSRALRDLADRISDRRVANRQLAVQMSSWVARNFNAEGALNVAWAALSPKYAAWKAKQGGALHILVGYGPGSGLLRDSWANFGYDNDSATVGTSVKYAPYHELGVPVNNLPARPMLPTKAIALQDAMDVYNNFIRQSTREVGLN